MASLELKQEIQEALKNQTLSRTLGTFCATYPAKREKSYAGVDFESTRDSIKEVKSYAADHIDEMIDDFTKNCTARGGHVFHAKSGEEAMDEPFINRVLEEGLQVIGMLKDNKQRYYYGKRLLGLKELASCCARLGAPSDYLGSVVVRTRNLQIPVKIVFVRNRNKRSEYILILSTDCT